MKKNTIALYLLLAISTTLIAQSATDVLPNPRQVEWSDMEIGVIIHLDINIFAPETFDYEKKATLPPLSAFNPSKINTDQWILSAKRAGAKYAVLTAKHGTGFCLWKTKVHDYHIGNTPVRGGGADIVADFIKSCKKYGLKPGIYYNTNMNTYYEAGYVKMSDEDRLKFNEAVYGQLKELWSEYGELFEIWFDGGVMSDRKTGIKDRVMQLLKDHQPNALLFNGPIGENKILRWVKNEDGRTPYPFWNRIDPVKNRSGEDVIDDGSGNADGKYWVGAEADFPNRNKSAWNGGWLWRAGEQDKVFSTEDLLNRYYTSVGRNTNVLIGMAIDTSGLFPSHDAKIFEDFGKKLADRKKSMIASTHGVGKLITLKFATEKEINQVEIAEEIAHGERIRAYQIDAVIDGQWKKICDGSSVGHKRIQLFDRVRTAELRLTISGSNGEPIVKSFSAYRY